MRLIERFRRDRTGATAIEYGLLVTVMAVALLGGGAFAFDGIYNLFATSSSRLIQALQ